MLKKYFSKLFFALLLVNLLSCSKLEFVLSWSDTFVMSNLSDYFELSPQQKKETRADYKKALHQIQTEDFPELAKLFNQMADSIERNKLNKDTIKMYIDQSTVIFKNGIQKFEPMAEKIIEDQVQNNFKVFDEEFSIKYNKDLLEAADPKRRADEINKRVKSWVDETIEFLTPEQKSKIDEALKKNPDPQLLQIESRKFVFEKFKSVRQDPIQRKEFVKKFFTDWESLQTPAYQKARKEYFEKVNTWLADLVLSLNSEQKNNFIKHLKKRASELQKLSYK